MFRLKFLRKKRHTTRAPSAPSITEETQMEPLASNVICYYTSREEVLDQLS